MISASRADTITFEYESENTQSRSSTFITFSREEFFQPTPKFSSSLTTITGWRLKKLYSNRGDSIRFVPSSTLREDFQGSKSLSEIVIYKSGYVTKRFRFEYSYFTGVQYPNDTYANKYLRLDKIKEYDRSGQNFLPPYSFDYHNSAALFPNRYSNAHDHWGFFNGAQDDSLEPSESHAKTGMLKRIIYPTGGYKEWDFEIHDFSNLVTNEYEQISPNPDSPVFRMLSEGTQSQAFTLPSTARGYITWNKPCSGPDLVNCYLRIINSSGAVWSSLLANGSQYIELPAGDYTIQARMVDGGEVNFNPPADYIQLDVSGLKVNGNLLVNKKGGGLRVKSISYRDTPQSNPIQYIFDYHQIGTKSSGWLAGRVKNTYYQWYENRCIMPDTLGILRIPEFGELFKVFNRKNFAPQQSLHGSYVMYGKVSITQINSSITNGRSVYHFSGLGFSDNTTVIDFPPVEDGHKDYELGLLLREEQYVYNSLTNSYSKLKTKTNSYTKVDQQFLTSLSAGYIYNFVCPDNIHEYCHGVFSGDPVHVVKVYREYTGRSLLTVSIDSLFSEQTFTVTKTETQYSANYQPKQQWLKNENGTTIKRTLFNYAVDAVSNPVIDYMIANNIVSAPIEAMEYKKDGIVLPVQRTKINYDLDNTAGVTLWVKRSIELARDGNAYITADVYSHYDKKGNLLQRTAIDGKTKSYVWSPDGLPVAVAVGAPLAAVYYNSFENDPLGNSPDAKMGKKSREGSFTFNLPGTGDRWLSYWRKGNGQTDWQLVEQLINQTSVTIGQAGEKVDDVRVFPIGCQVTTFAYEGDRLLSSADPNQIVTTFNYDDFGRLLNQSDHNKDIITSILYGFRN
jgi:YD repeat-containing protein